MRNHIKNHLLTYSSALMLLVGIAIGLSLFMKSQASGGGQVAVGGASAVGTTFSTQRIAQIVFAPTTGSATTTSIYNGDDNDRVVDSAYAYCSGVGTSLTAYTGTGLANWILSAATTSSSAPNAITNTNLAMNMVMSTSSAFSFTSTSTPSSYLYNVTGNGAATTSATQSAVSRVWAAGTYMTFGSNATNTAACIVGVRYFGT